MQHCPRRPSLSLPLPPAGTDGHSPELALLKNSSLAPNTAFVAPCVYTLIRLDNRPIVRRWRGSSDCCMLCCR